jgi:4-amino-4-deoxy-L-arabinose transferase-like glycosyltransferase
VAIAGAFAGGAFLCAIAVLDTAAALIFGGEPTSLAVPLFTAGALVLAAGTAGGALALRGGRTTPRDPSGGGEQLGVSGSAARPVARTLIAVAVVGVAGAVAPQLAADTLTAGFGRLQLVAVACAGAVGLVGVSSPQLVRRLASQRAVHTALRLLRVDHTAKLQRFEVATLGALVVAFGAALALVIAIPPPLGHDESVYALWARHWLEGTPMTGVSAHRAPGIPVLAMPALLVSHGEAALRAVGWPFGVLAVVSVWWLGRQVGGAVAALVAAAVFATAPTIIGQSALLLTDVPAAALLIVVAAVLWRELEVRPAPSWWLVAVAPLAAAAFEIRYGSIVAITALALGGLAVWLPQLVRAWRKLAVTGGLFALLLAPHVVGALRETGSPVGKLLGGADLAGGGEYNAVEGLVRYAELFPFRLAGPLAAGAMAVAVVGAIGALIRARTRDRDGRAGRARVFLLVTAGAQVVLFGTLSGPNARYVLFAIGLLCVLAGFELTRATTRLATSRLAPLAPVAMLSALLLVGLYGAISFGFVYGNRRNSFGTYAEVVSAADRAQAISDGSCSVMTSYKPQMTWYSQCATYSFGDLDRLTGESQFVFLIGGGKRQPEDARLRRCREALGLAVARFDDSDGKTLGDSALYPVERTSDASCARG